MTAQPRSLDEDVCAVCGHRVDWRELGALHHEGLAYCSAGCHDRRGDRRAVALERAILSMLAERRQGSTVCPSEVARRIGGEDEAHWRPLLEPVREAARRLVADGRVEVTQRGQVVDPSAARGPIRLRAVDG